MYSSYSLNARNHMLAGSVLISKTLTHGFDFKEDKTCVAQNNKMLSVKIKQNRS